MYRVLLALLVCLCGVAPAQATSITNLTTGTDETAGSTATTASVAPASMCLQLLTIAPRPGANDTTVTQPTATGNSLTWEPVIGIAMNDAAGTKWQKVFLLRSMGASPTAGTIAIDFAGQSQDNIVWVLDQVCGVDKTGSNGAGAVVQSATNQDLAGGTTLTVTLGAFTSVKNATYGTFGIRSTGTTTVGSGFGDNVDAATSSTAVSTEFRADNDTTVDMTFGTSSKLGGIAVEIAATTTRRQAIQY